MSHRIIIADVLDGLAQLDDESVQCIVTSPPYWNLRNYGVDGQIGLEPTISEYVEKMRDVFRECKRVLRNDGTLWLNLGDSYIGYKGDNYCTNPSASNLQKKSKVPASHTNGTPQTSGLKSKDLCGIPWRVAFALQDDGWYLRKDIIWAKPNPMPESVRDRPTSAHEYIFLLTKSARYFYDADAIAEDSCVSPDWNEPAEKYHHETHGNGETSLRSGFNRVGQIGGKRNARSVWTIATEPYSGSHYAVFPSELPRRCILAGTSAAGACAACGAAYERVTAVGATVDYGGYRKRADAPGAEVSETSAFRTGQVNTRLTTGWKPTCNCNAETIPCTVLDPFAGSGTTIQVAIELGRNVIGIDLDERNRALIQKRILGTTPPLEGIA